MNEAGRHLYLDLTLAYPLRRLGPLVIAISLGAAVLRRRLWDIDLIVDRSLVGGMLAALLAALLGASLYVIPRAFPTLTGGQHLLIALPPRRRRLEPRFDPPAAACSGSSW